MKKVAGFTLIESLVALVILTGIFSVVWNWFATAITSTAKIEHAIAQPAVFDAFIERLQLVDLKTKRQGVINLDTYEIRWVASIERESTNDVFRRQPGWIVALFNIQCDVYFNNKIITNFTTKQYAQWRDPNAAVEFPGL